MIIVSNTSPLSSLAKIDRSILLQQIYSQIIIPQAVYNELLDIRAGEKVTSAIQNASWITSRQAIDSRLVSHLEENLDRGEAEVIALAVELNADRLIIDERLGRREAKALGLSITGVLGVLLIAKKRGAIANVKEEIDRLISESAFRVSDRLYRSILQEVGENER
jgi:predicted nucleic acid-binding protein